ncbi:MAG: carboxypeptidase-like regulatory domain-containing protein [Planctomycetota bacterium]|jgi:hypothetical protein
MKRRSTTLHAGACSLAAACTIALAGCGNGHYPIGGKVMLDGAPLAEALVAFASETDGEKFACAKTDGEGNYSFTQPPNEDGLAAGKYAVRITTYREGKPDEDPPIPSVREKVPLWYNVQTELSAEVTPDQHVFHFDLTSRR